jgi:hypothetical protein
MTATDTPVLAMLKGSWGSSISIAESLTSCDGFTIVRFTPRITLAHQPVHALVAIRHGKTAAKEQAIKAWHRQCCGVSSAPQPGAAWSI